MIFNLILSILALFAVLGTVLAMCASKKSSASVTVLPTTATGTKSQRSGSNQSRKSSQATQKSKVQPSSSQSASRQKSPQYVTLKVKSLSMLPINNASAMLMGKSSKKVNTISQPKPDRVWSNTAKMSSSSQNLFNSFQQSQLSRKKLVSETEMPKSDYLSDQVSSIKSSGSGYYATLMKQMKVKSVSQYITPAYGQPQY